MFPSVRPLQGEGGSRTHVPEGRAARGGRAGGGRRGVACAHSENVREIKEGGEGKGTGKRRNERVDKSEGRERDDRAGKSN